VATTTTIAYPTGAVIVQGPMSSYDRPDKCFQANSPGVVGSGIDRRDCDGGADQDIAVVGAASIVALRFTDGPNAGLCFAESGYGVVLAPCDGGPAQLFDLVDNGSTFLVVSRSNGRCMRQSWLGLILWPCNGDDDQLFTF
jgi:hypothetical protein